MKRETYPIGQQNFKNLIERGFTYVDKTSYIIPLLGGSCFFLSRPRRFGKSLFLSTLEYFFKGERELFKGLAIDSSDWKWEEYPVIRIDFTIGGYTEEYSLTKNLDNILSPIEAHYGLKKESDDVAIRLSQLIRGLYRKYGRQVVVLVDEYEKPVIDNIDKPDLMDKNREILRGFYSVLKGSQEYLKLVFLTGVTRFGKMNIFSGLNNLQDISLDDRYAALCGITEEELIKYFPQGIHKLADTYKTDYDGMLALLKKNYDGYHFSGESPDIYNPWAVLHAMDNIKLEAYWSVSGTPKLLATLLMKTNKQPKDMDNIKADWKQLLGIDNQFDDLVTLFYQTGYLTIKSYNLQQGRYVLGYPNKEVRDAFFEYLLPNYAKSTVTDSRSFLLDFNDALEEGNPQQAMEILKSFTATFDYDMIPAPEMERHFQTVMYLISRLILPYRTDVEVEEHTSDGRIDMVIKTSEYVYIIEIKRDSSQEYALKQIKDKDYSLPYRSDPRKVFLIGVNFSTTKRRIDGYLIKTL